MEAKKQKMTSIDLGGWLRSVLNSL